VAAITGRHSSAQVPAPPAAEPHVCAQEDITTTVSAWSQYKAFVDARDALAGASWDAMRNELHAVDDFVATWAKAGEAMDASAMKLTLLRDVDAYRRCACFTHFGFVMICETHAGAGRRHVLHVRNRSVYASTM
jgi:hypothetical protein